MIQYLSRIFEPAKRTTYFGATLQVLIALLVLMCLITSLLGCSKTGESQENHGTDIPILNPDIPIENLSIVDCEGERCLKIEPSSEYCSVDLQELPLSGYFSTKARLSITAGAYPLNMTDKTLPDIPISVRTPNGEMSLRPQYPLQFEIDPFQAEPLNRETIRLLKPNPYISNDLTISRLIFSTTHINDFNWPDSHFRLGDSNNIWWWFAASRHLVAKVDQKSALFPELEGYTEIKFAPCEFEGQTDDLFSFQFENRETLTLTVRSFSTIWETGNYMGRLLKAQGEFLGHPVNVQKIENLAFIGSNDTSEMRMPGLVVRWSETAGVCGVVFDPDNKENNNWAGWKAYRLTCYGERGLEVPLANVEYPDKYVIP